MTSNELATFSAEHEPAAHLVFLALDGGRLAREERLELHAREPHEDEWAKGTDGNAECHARRYSGAHSSRRQSRGIQRNNAGIAEETRISLEAGQPVFVLGGFGGCARDVAETVGLIERWVRFTK